MRWRAVFLVLLLWLVLPVLLAGCGAPLRHPPMPPPEYEEPVDPQQTHIPFAGDASAIPQVIAPSASPASADRPPETIPAVP